MKPECVYIQIERADGFSIMHFVVRAVAGKRARDYLTAEQIEAGFAEAAEKQDAKTAKAKATLREAFDAELDKVAVLFHREPTDEAIEAEIAKVASGWAEKYPERLPIKSWKRVDSPERTESMKVRRRLGVLEPVR